MERERGDVEELVRHRTLPIVSDSGRSELAAELTRHLRGEVRFDAGYRALYATDASNYRQVPIGVVLPRDTNDVVAAIAICRAFGVPIVGRGGGTSLAGQTCNAAVVLDFSKHVHGILELDPERRYARVEPGVVLDDLRQRAEEFHLTFGPDPATHTHCTLGGMIGNNSCGVHAMMSGCTAENVEELEVLTYQGDRFVVGATTWPTLEAIARTEGRRGEIHRAIAAFIRRHEAAIRDGFPEIPRRVSGYDLPALLGEDGPHLARALVGSEGTLVTVLSAKVRLVPSPRCRVLLVLGYPSICEAADHVTQVRESRPIGLEGIDEVLGDDMKRKKLHPERIELLPEGRGWLLVEFGGDTREEAESAARALMARLERAKNPPRTKLFDDPEQEAIVWKVRESGLGATARVPGQLDTWEGWEDAAVSPDRPGSYLRKFHELLQRYEYRAALYGHFGQGCVHTRIPFDLRHEQGIAKFRAFVEEAADLVVAHGGSLSGEHGDGQSRAELLPKMFGPELMRAFEEWKAIWDPDDKMNPGKIVRPRRLDENLRLGASYRAARPRTHFRFPDDAGSFGYATERCVGVGECRRLEGGTMCPSYRVTREEMHSTRGRARLLFEMMRGDPLAGGFRNDAVREALDLCLSCKGCKGECPVNVDMAAYKAEFLSHYYEGRLRPRSAYAFGLVFWWARVASLFPSLVNLLLRAPVVGRTLKWIAGVDARRTLPRFARVTFREWWRNRPASPGDGPRVLLWVDTWSNHFEPAVAIAAVEVLESAGFRVVVPGRSLCCGRPLYDYGMLTSAKRRLRQILETLRPALRAGVPVVALEPSCLSVFRDELVNLFPNDPEARRLEARALLIGDFLAHHAPGWNPPQLRRRALIHGHCHHQAMLGFREDCSLCRDMGLTPEILDAGCCGMAGAFGYERDHYAVSVACAERQLAPAVRRAPDDALIVADGFSCRAQIEQRTNRRALHTAQVLRMAREQGPAGPPGARPELGYVDVRSRVPWRRTLRNTALLALGIGAVLALLRGRARRGGRARGLRGPSEPDSAASSALIVAAYRDMKARLG
ncbi:MAG: FAD-linked oxidase C-terminal domain-containing protein [Pseudomonadota bacterium]|nr:MAG: FAD-binding oxidoreductase [Pseudomonadota bacterium]